VIATPTWLLLSADRVRWKQEDELAGGCIEPGAAVEAAGELWVSRSATIVDAFVDRAERMRVQSRRVRLLNESPVAAARELLRAAEVTAPR
jgi:hypothetical protein